jgi:outer membrane protein assembly complex protein YaeT
MTATDRFSIAALRTASLALALAAGVAVALAQAPSAPGRIVVNDVTPQGNRVVPAQKIMSLVHTRPGADYLQETVNEDVRRLMETKQFANVWASLQYTPDGKVNVYFNFVEEPNTVQEVVYQGAHHLKPDDLTSITGVRKGMPLNPVANQMACQSIVRRYQDDGRLFASCELLEGGKAGDTRVVFQITEGPVVKVSAIEFDGNSTFVSSARLATQINSGREWLGCLGGRYNATMAELDALKLEEYYKSFGYQDARVSRELKWEPDLRHVRLIFHIHEGQRYKVKDVVVEGGSTFSTEQLSVLPRLHQGEFYSEQKADADVNAIKDYYGWAGYPTTVKKELYYPEEGVCLVKYEVQERPPWRVGQVFISGNEVTRQNVILRQVPLYPGQVFMIPDLKIAERNLDRLGLFTDPQAGIHPHVEVIDPDTDSTFKDILVSVQEQRTGSLIFGVGVNSDAGLVGSVVLNERNFDITRFPTSVDDLLSGRAFRGGGQELRLEAVPGTQLQRYAATWREPFLFDSPYSLTVGGYYYDRVFDEYTESRLGTRITLGRKLNDNWSVSGTVRIEDVGVHHVPIFAPQDFQSVLGDNFLAGFRAAVTRDTRDSFMRPTEGNRLDISFEEVTGDFTFPVVNIEDSQYFTVYQRADGSGRHVLALRSQMAWEGSNAPVFERFYAGGYQSMRGFQFRGVGPDINGFKVGGDFMFLNSIEYQVPVRANDQIYLVAFVDSGAVEPRLELKDYRVSAGVGIRFIVPMLGPVPIALDVGFPIVKGPHDREQDFSFSLGFFH